MNKSATIRDVAKNAGVSVSTVSRILSGAETPILISAETRERVVQTAQRLSYRPNPGARSLRGSATNMLGLIVREIDDPWFTQLIRVISHAAKEYGIEIVLGHAEADPNNAARLSEMMLDLRYCDGLFLMGDLYETEEDQNNIRKIAEHMPLVMLNRGNNALVDHFPSVSVNNRAGICLGLEYLFSLGHRDIVCLGGRRPGDLNERQQAFRDGMSARFGRFSADLIHPAENSLEGGFQGMSELLASGKMPTAVFVSDDMMAIGAIKAIHTAGLRIPEDISVMGFDDIKVAAFLNPSLTTIRQPVEKIGQSGLALMLKRLHEKQVEDLEPHISIEPELVIRNSCCPPSH